MTTSPYNGKLTDLLPVLSLEAVSLRGAWPLDRSWAKRALKGGAEVAVRIDQNGHREVRISRTKTPDSEKAWAAWRSELGTFHHHLGTKGWTAVEERQDNGISATFAEPIPEPGHPSDEPSLQGVVTQLDSEGPTDSTRRPAKPAPAGSPEAGEQARVGRSAHPGAGG